MKAGETPRGIPASSTPYLQSNDEGVQIRLKHLLVDWQKR